MKENLSSKKIVNSETGNRIRHVRGQDAQKEFAKKLGYSSSYLSEVESGKTKPSIALILKISYITNYSLHWLLTGEGPMLLEPSESMVKEHIASYGELGEFALIPLIVVEGERGIESEGVEARVQGKYAFRRTWLQSKGNLEDFVLFAVRGDSMDPTITDGDFVLIDRSQKEVVVGNIYAFRIENAVMVKRLQPMGDRRITAMSDNKLYESYELDLGAGDIEVIGQIIWIGRELVK